VGLVIDQVVKGNDPRGGCVRICGRDMAHVRVGHGMACQNYCVMLYCVDVSFPGFLFLL
jgi:hypothetical protein